MPLHQNIAFKTWQLAQKDPLVLAYNHNLDMEVSTACAGFLM